MSPPLGPGDQLLRMPAGLLDPRLDLWRKPVLRLAALIAAASMLQLLILLKADDHRRWAAVMGEDRWLMAIPGAANQLADVLACLTDRHLTHTPNCTTAPRQPPPPRANPAIERPSRRPAQLPARGEATPVHAEPADRAR